MTSVEFAKIVEKICKRLEFLSVKNPNLIAACNTGESFEKCVVDATKETLSALGIPHIVSYTPGSHVFPDIIVEFESGERYGIEVKSSSSPNSKNWKINGNSVLGSTKEDVADTYIIFGKTAIGNQGFRYRRYEDAIANVAVTHSPRYAIDMELSPGETFFAKSKLTYNQISESDDPIGLITTYFRSKGEKAWWLAENTPAAIRMFSDLSVEEQSKLTGYCFAHFPEIFSSGCKKFYRSALWLITEQSVVSPSLRDNFTAGGRINISLDDAMYQNVSRIFSSLYRDRENILSELTDASSDELLTDWGWDGPIDDTLELRLSAWISVTANELTYKYVNNYDRKKILSDIMTAQKVDIMRIPK